jgi:hypothetical protein
VPERRGSSTLPSRNPPLAPDLLGSGRPQAELHPMSSQPTDGGKVPRGRDFDERGPLGNAWGAGWISRCRHRRDIAGMHPNLGTSFTGRDVWNRPDRVGARHGTFREGRPARLTSHHPGCSVRVNGAGGGMKGTRLGVGFADRLLSFLGPGSDEPPLSSIHITIHLGRTVRAALSTPWPGRGQSGGFGSGDL